MPVLKANFAMYLAWSSPGTILEYARQVIDSVFELQMPWQPMSLTPGIRQEMCEVKSIVVAQAKEDRERKEALDKDYTRNR